MNEFGHIPDGAEDFKFEETESKQENHETTGRAKDIAKKIVNKMLDHGGQENIDKNLELDMANISISQEELSAGLSQEVTEAMVMLINSITNKEGSFPKELWDAELDSEGNYSNFTQNLAKFTPNELRRALQNIETVTITTPSGKKTVWQKGPLL